VPFFTRRNAQDFDGDEETDSDGMESQNDEDLSQERSDEAGMNAPSGSATGTGES
jgi:hypothetical protein